MTALLLALVVIPGTIGDLLNSAGMKHLGEITDFHPRALMRVAGRAVRNRYILASIPAMAISFFALMALLSSNAVSFAIPLTASSYIVETALAKYLLHEKVDWHRWAGACLVGIGISLLSI